MRKFWTWIFFIKTTQFWEKSVLLEGKKFSTYFWDQKIGYFCSKIWIYENPKPDKWNPNRLEPENKMLGSNRTEPEKKIKTRTRTEPDFLLPDTSLTRPVFQVCVFLGFTFYTSKKFLIKIFLTETTDFRLYVTPRRKAVENFLRSFENSNE